MSRILIEFGKKHGGLKIKKGKLSGIYAKYSMLTIKLPFITITIPNKELGDAMGDSLRSQASQNDWELANAPSIIEYKKAYNLKIDNAYSDKLQKLKDEVRALKDETVTFYSQKCELERTIKNMAKVFENYK